MTAKEKRAEKSSISYISALILIFITGVLMVSVILPRTLDSLLLLALLLSTNVVYLQWRTPSTSFIEITSIVLFDILYFIEIFEGKNLIILTAIISLSLILAAVVLVRRDIIALIPVVALAMEGALYPPHNAGYLAILLVLSIMPLASSRRIHSLLPLIASLPIILVSHNTLISILTTLTYILFISDSIETRNKCPFRREVSLVIGGFLIQASIILSLLFSYEPSRLFAYWVLGYMISAIGLTSPPFYRPAQDTEVVYKTDV